MRELTIEATPENVDKAIEFVDNGRPYDSLAKEDPDTTQSIEDRPIGGMGILIEK